MRQAAVFFILSMFFIPVSSAATATFRSSSAPGSGAGSSPSQFEQRNQAAESRITRQNENAQLTAEATTEPQESFEPYPNQGYVVTVTLNSAGKIVSTYYMDRGANDHRAQYTYNSSGMLVQVTETISGCQGEACFSTSRTQRFGRDSRGRFILTSKAETGVPTLTYSYWYDSSNPTMRHYRARTSSGTEYGVGRETLDGSGRVTYRRFLQTSSSTAISDFEQTEGIHQYPMTGRNVVTQHRFSYDSQDGRSYVRESAWYNGASTSLEPDNYKIYRVARSIQLRERYTQNRFAPGDRSTVASRYTILQSFSV